MAMAPRNASSGWGEEAAHTFARLLERLDGGLSCRLILVVAPAKSGKTAPPPAPKTIVVKRREDWVDLTWSLINSSEFLYRH